VVIQPTAPSLIYVAFRHWRTIVAVVLLAVGGAGAYGLLSTPQYQADAQLVVKFNMQRTIMPGLDAPAGGTPGDHDQILASHLLQLQGRGLAEQVIRSVGVATIYPRMAETDGPGTWFDQLRRALGLEDRSLDAAVDRFVGKDLKVKLAKNSNVIQLAYLNPDPEVAKRALATLIDRFLEQEARLGRDPNLEFVQSQVEHYRRQVTEAQGAMEAFQLKNGISAMDEETTQFLRQRADLEAQLTLNRIRVEESQNKMKVLRQQMSGLREVVNLNQESRDPALDAARTQLVQLQMRHQVLRKTFEPDSPAVQDVEAQIARTNDAIAGFAERAQQRQTAPNPTHQFVQSSYLQAQADLEGASKAQPTIVAQLDRIAARLADLSRVQATYQDLVREYQIVDQNYRAYLQGVQQARIADDLNKQKVTTISIFDPATASADPVKPRRLLLVAMGALLGIVLGLTAAFVREALDERLNTHWQVGRLLGLPVLGSMGRVGEPVPTRALPERAPA
jgi:polysaccharide biosynthesis protein PslE